MDYIACTRDASGRTIMAYIPQDAMTPTVDMTKMSGSTANAWWYNPRTGVATAIGTYSTAGTQAFTPTDTSDWVLVLDDASQNYGPPGVVKPSPNQLSLQASGGNLFQLSSAGFPGQVYTLLYTTNLTVPWQTLGTATAGISGTFIFDAAATSSASFYRSSYP
jgi:hypothetical protein